MKEGTNPKKKKYFIKNISGLPKSIGIVVVVVVIVVLMDDGQRD